jgi:signal transduction histidine kinase
MSHELRTPMNAIIGFTDLLDMQITDPQQKRSLRHINASAYHLLAMIENILDYVHIDTSRMLALEDSSINLAECVRESLALVLPRTAGKKLQLLSEIDPSLPQFMRGDLKRLRQVLLLLLDNAVKFTAAGGPSSFRVERDSQNCWSSSSPVGMWAGCL